MVLSPGFIIVISAWGLRRRRTGCFCSCSQRKIASESQKDDLRLTFDSQDLGQSSSDTLAPQRALSYQRSGDQWVMYLGAPCCLIIGMLG
jgi:hypothetical protein